MQVNEKVFVVTGGGNGIGRAVVMNLLAKGAKVVAVDINSEALTDTQHLAVTFSNHLRVYTANISRRDEVEKIPQFTLDEFGHVDGIVNVAGIIQPFVTVNDMDYDRIERVFNVNFYGTLYMCKAFIPHLLQRPDAHILNVSSMGGFVPVPGQTIYGASKAAVKLLTEGLKSELMDTNIGVSVVFPGGVATEITKNSGVETNFSADVDTSRIKVLTPQEAADIIVHAIENNLYHVYAGSDSKMLNFMNRLSPRRAARMIAEQLKSLMG
jgi:short-subunit dehydrogenase